LEKNPDEFYFGMMNKKGPSTMGKNRTGTVDGDRGNQVLSQDAVRLFKTQDLGYVRTMRNKASKEVEELENRVVGIKGDGKRIVFVQDEEEQREKLGEDDVDMNEDKEEDIPVDLKAKNLKKMQDKEADKLQARLSIARQRLKALADAEEALDLQRAKMAKSPAAGGVNKAGVKFKVRERKR
jgi:U3 small nucleolar RNA-associated protein 11